MLGSCSCVSVHSLSLPDDVEETREVREKMGIMVHYNVKVRCVVSFGK